MSTPTIVAGLNWPDGIAVDAAGKIYVADVKGNNVTTYNADGTQTTPTIAAGVSAPVGVAVDANGKIYVTNSTANTLTTYTADGTPTTPTITTGLFVPSGVVVDATGRSQHSRRSCVRPRGQALRRRLWQHRAPRRLVQTYFPNGMQIKPMIFSDYPLGVAVDEAGKIYIANSGLQLSDPPPAVNTYTPDGMPSTPNITLLYNPFGIAVH